MKIGLDTNILVRYLTEDDPEQADRVQELFDSYKSEATFIINEVILAELDWVLTSVYGYSRKEFLMVIEQIFETKHISFSQPTVVKKAIREYASSSADFLDCYIGILNKKMDTKITFTFDKAASNLAHFSLLQ
ncbi:PIN domain-containing protein [Halalkalibaculum sp. DA3122]|uniref:PIN domain-containing protein n=1 Tax=unclassified Halalkalibaculum TaxID=2964617 RepID=UPI0037547019